MVNEERQIQQKELYQVMENGMDELTKEKIKYQIERFRRSNKATEDMLKEEQEK